MKSYLLAAFCAAFCFTVFILGPDIGMCNSGQNARQDNSEVLETILKRLEYLTHKNDEKDRVIEQLSQKIEDLELQIKSTNRPPVPTGKDDAFQAMDARIKTLEDRTLSDQIADIENLQENVANLSDILEVVERKSIMDHLSWSAELRSRMDWYDFKEDRTNHEEENHGVGNIRFRLNLFSKISKNLRLSGRLTMYKYWLTNEKVTGSGLSLGSINASRVPSDEDLHVERAYMDYYFRLHEKLPVCLSFGRLPTTDSLPTHFREDGPRKSAYPALAYDAEVDGIALSFSLKELTGWPGANFKILYSRDARPGSMLVYRTNSALDDFEAFMVQFETELGGRFTDSLFIINFLYYPQFDTVGTGFSSTGLASLLKPVDIPGHSAKIWKLTGYLEFRRFLETNFDWFVSFAYLSVSNEHLTRLRVGPVVIPGGFGYTTTKDRDRSSTAFYAGIRYTLPWELCNESKLGIEFNRNTKGWFGHNVASEDPMWKLHVNGKTWDFYYLQPVTRHFHLRLGYTMTYRKYMNWGIGNPQRVNHKMTNTYLLLNAKFY